MGENYEEMNLDVGKTYVPKAIARILAEASKIDDFAKKASMLEFHVREMEKEITKVEYFKRELPQCMHFLQDAIEILKEEMLWWKGREKGPVMVEFLQSRTDFEGCGGMKESRDINKKRWTCSAHLWSTPVQYQDNFYTRNQDSLSQQRSSDKGEEGNDRDHLFKGCNLKNKRETFVPFKKPDKNDSHREGVDPVYDLELSIDLNLTTGDQHMLESQQQLQQKKKHRRCWSPELHRRFLHALRHLGGEQSATPKQIKELMKVEGLTNDQVKSHLQKYRLHVRKFSTSSVEPLDGSSWLTQDQCGGLSNTTVAHSGSPQGPLQRGGSGKRDRP